MESYFKENELKNSHYLDGYKIVRVVLDIDVERSITSRPAVNLRQGTVRGPWDIGINIIGRMVHPFYT